MKYVYFTKTLKGQDIKGLVAFCKECGLDGVDLTVRPGYPVTPANALKALPEAAKAFADAGLIIGLVTAPVGLVDPEGKEAGTIFDACARAKVPAVKIGYFGYKAPFDTSLKAARDRMGGFAKLAARTKVKACYHTHSGGNIGNNAASLRMLLEGLDPHNVGAFFDTGHTAVNGGPAAMEMDIIRPWLSLVAIKDMAWSKDKGGWKVGVVPVGGGIVRWADVDKGLKACKFNGTVSVHGEYEAASLDERKKLAKEELAALKKHFGG
jgi:sugar phosphate isomerase/epimerase